MITSGILFIIFKKDKYFFKVTYLVNEKVNIKFFALFSRYFSYFLSIFLTKINNYK